MDGLIAFRRIFAFLLAQTAILSAWAIFDTLIFVSDLGRAPMVASATIAMVFGGLTLLVLRMAWPMAASGIELFWGTSVKLQAERWMQPSLGAGAIACLLGALMLLIAGNNELVRVIAEGAVVCAFLASLAVSLLLVISAIRRRSAYRSSLETMSANAGTASGLERARISISSESGQSETTVRPNSQGFTFAGLTSKPWHEPSEFSWVAEFEKATDAIAEEFERVQTQHGGDIHAYKYAGLDGKHWKSFQLATRHHEIRENAELCPITTRLLKTIPHYPSFRDAMFSILDGGGVIAPHRDVSNVFLTMHLPLIAPGNGFMEVGGLRKEWRRGEAMIFDSSYHHQAQNNASSPRVVLLVDFLHPDLTQEEAAWVTASRL